MGDAGSLSIGACLAAIALLTNHLLILLIMGGIFFFESISVIIQVAIFKITKQITGQGYRVFKMAPLHHHFELSGLKEHAIVKSFWIITLGLILISVFFFLKPL